MSFNLLPGPVPHKMSLPVHSLYTPRWTLLWKDNMTTQRIEALPNIHFYYICPRGHTQYVSFNVRK